MISLYEFFSNTDPKLPVINYVAFSIFSGVVWMGPFTIENASDFHEKRTSFKMLFSVEHLKTGPRRISVDSQSEGFRKRERYGTFVDDPCGVFWSFPTTLMRF